jgi:hypothetical protein
MPRALELRLRREAQKKGLSGKGEDAYAYSTVRKTGWKPKRIGGVNGPECHYKRHPTSRVRS